MYQRIDIDDYVRTGEGATAVAYTHRTEPRLITDGKRDLWIDLGLFSHGVPEWDIAQLWVFTNRLDEDRLKRLLPFAAVRIPFMLNMAYRRPISEGLAKFVINQIG